MGRQQYILPVLFLGLISTYTFGYQTTELAFDVPQLISGATVDIDSPAIAMDQTGNIIVAWAQKHPTGSTYAIFAVRYNYQTNTWTAIKRISSYATISYKPEIAMNPAGNAVVAWVTSNSAYAAYFYVDAGWTNAWSAETVLDSGIITSIRVAMDTDGNVMAVWPNLSSGIQASLYDIDYNSWQTATAISAVGSSPNVAFDELGRAIAVWRQSTSLYTSRYTPGQTWPTGWTAKVLIDNSVFSSTFPSVDTAKTALGSAAGNAMVTYQGTDQLSIKAAFYDDQLGFATGWQSPQTISSAVAYYYNQAVKMDEDGGAVATWLQEDLASNVHSARFDGDVKSWILPDVLISPTSQDAKAPDLAMDKYGDALATWYRVKTNPDTTVELIIQANQNADDGSWYPAHDISLLDTTENFASAVTINDNYMAAAAWGFPYTSLYVSRALEIPSLTSHWVTLGTATAIYTTASGDGVFYVDIISNGIVYTWVHYPNTATTAWTRTQISPSTLYAYEIAGSTDTDGNHVIVWTAATTTRAAARTAYLTTTRTKTTTTTRTLEVITTTAISDPGQDAAAPHVTLQQPRTTTTRTTEDLISLYGFLDRTTTRVYTGRTTTTTRKNTDTRTVGSLQEVSPEGAFCTNSYIPESATAIATVWLITDSQQGNITRVQGNYQASTDDYAPQGYRYISPDNVDIAPTVTPLVYVDSQGCCLFAWITQTAGNLALQVSSFRMSDIHEVWTTFSSNAQTLETISTTSGITTFSITGDSYNAVLTRAIYDDAASYYYNHKTTIWSLVDPVTRTRSLMDLLNSDEPEENLMKAFTTTTRLATTGIGYTGTRGTTTTTTRTTTTRKTTRLPANTTTTTIQACQLDGFTKTTLSCDDTTVDGAVTHIAAATSWTGARQATATTRTATTTTTKTLRTESDDNEDEEDILEVLLTGPALTQPLSPAHVQGRQEIHRFPRYADIVNIITWQAAALQAQTPVAVTYKIFLTPNTTTPVATIDAHDPLRYTAHNKSSNTGYTYYIYAVDDQGTYSDPVKVTLP